MRDDDEQWIALRYDLTAPLARVVAEYPSLPKPFRRYQVGPVWRREQKPGVTRFREFIQCDFDTVGSESMAADAEVCAVLATALNALGIESDQFVIRVNNRKLLNGLLEAIDVNDPGHRVAVMRQMDKFDKFSVEDIALLLGPGRRDDSGSFTEGTKLADRQIETVLKFLQTKQDSRAATCEAVQEFIKGDSGAEGVAELLEISRLLDAMELPDSVVAFDPSVVRGLEYYTGPVVEAELTFQVADEDGRTRSFGSVAGGGRYDYLVERFTGQKVPATGASIGVDRLLAALEILKASAVIAEQGPIVVTVMDRDRLVDYQEMVRQLRGAGIRAELYLGSSGFRAQMKYADKRSSPITVIAGSNEFDEGVVTLKDMELGRRLSSEITDHSVWKEQPAQVSVPRENLIASIQEILQRHSDNEKSEAGR